MCAVPDLSTEKLNFAQRSNSSQFQHRGQFLKDPVWSILAALGPHSSAVLTVLGDFRSGGDPL